MKQKSFTNTGAEVAQKNQAGLPLGNRGAPEQSNIAPKISATELDEAKEFLRLFAQRAFKGETNLDLARAKKTLALVEGGCDWNKAGDHLGEMIDAYARNDTSETFLTIRANDFMRDLDQYPTWAVIRSIRWWKGHENEFRFRSPFPGDLVERCRLETTFQRVARTQLTKLSSKK